MAAVLVVLRQSWALLLGVLLLLVGNGLHGTLLGVRGAIEGFDAATMSWVMSAYFVGFLLGSRRAPVLIRNVGHVRVFAALASMISAAFILYAAAPSPLFWIAMRFVVGFCFAGVYVVAESWLNEAATNETRGQALSLYVFVQMVGIITAQGFLNFGDPSGYNLFILISVLVSVSFLPILLSAVPAPAYDTAKPMSLRELFRISPLGCVGMMLLGGIFSGLFGMAAVYGSEKGLTVAEIASFVASIYVGGMIFQVPVGAASDRMDRRLLIIGLTLSGGVLIIAGLMFPGSFTVLLALGVIVGGVSNPLYSLLIAYTNDYLDVSDMAAASGGLVFINGLGAMMGPLVIGILMNAFGPEAFFAYLAALLFCIAGYASYRATQRPTPPTEETVPYMTVTPQASPVAVEVAQEINIEAAEEAAAEAAGAAGDEKQMP